MSDGSTVIVGGDKRAEPVYAHFDNLNLKINEKGEFVGDSIPEIIGNLLIRQNEMYRFCKTKCDFFVQNEMC